MADINEQFYAEQTRALDAAEDYNKRLDERVAAGELTALGNGRFRQNTGLDAGEVWSYRNGILLPQSGLDLSTGQAALYSAKATPEWHKLGNHIPGGTSDIDKVLELGGIGFSVLQAPVHFYANGKVRTDEDHFVNYRDDTDAALGVVGKRYQVFQNRQEFEFLQELTGEFGLIWDSAGALGNGERVFVSVKLPEDITIDPEGINDTVQLYIAVFNSHDGSSRFEVVVTPWRPICKNTERFALRDAKYKWGARHTRNGLQRVEEARRDLNLTLRFAEAFKADEELLAKQELERNEFQELIDSIWEPEDRDDQRYLNAKDKRENALFAELGLEIGRVGRTRYAAERAFTGYLDNVKPRRGHGGDEDRLAAVRASAILEGADDATKSKVHKLLIQRSR